MSSELRLRRGSRLQHEVFVGAPQEVTVVTDDSSLRVHDGATPGGVDPLNPVYVKLRQGSSHGGIWKSSTSVVEGRVYTDPVDNVDYMALYTGVSTARPGLAGTQFAFHTVVKKSLNPEDFGVYVSKTSADRPSLAVRTQNVANLQRWVNACMRLGYAAVYTGFIYQYGTVEVSRFADTPSIPIQNDYFGVQFFLQQEGLGGFIQTHPTAPAWVVRDGATRFTARDVYVFGEGSVTEGDLLQLLATYRWRLDNVILQGCGGRALYIVGAERGYATYVAAVNCRQGLVCGGAASNEIVFDTFDAIGCGFTQNPFNSSARQSYSSNPTDANGISIPGVYRSERRYVIDAQNITVFRINKASIKPTVNLGAIRVRGGGSIIFSGLYPEGFVDGAVNASLTIGGPSEDTTLSSSISGASSEIPVTQTKWFRSVSTNPAYDQYFEPQRFVIYDPATYVKGDASTYEFVDVKCWRSGSARSVVRGVNGTPAKAWAAGVKIREYLNTSATTEVRLQDSNLRSYYRPPAGSEFRYSSTTPGQTGSVGNGSTYLTVPMTEGAASGEIVLGHLYDEFHVDNTVTGQYPFSLLIENNDATTMAPLMPDTGGITSWFGGSVNAPDGKLLPRNIVSMRQVDPVSTSLTYSLFSYVSPQVLAGYVVSQQTVPVASPASMSLNTLFVDVIPANTLLKVGDALEGVYSMLVNNTAATKTPSVAFGVPGAEQQVFAYIPTPVAGGVSGTIEIRFRIVRLTSSSVRYTASAAVPGGAATPAVFGGDLGGIPLSAETRVLLRNMSGSGAVASDVIARVGRVDFKPGKI